MNLISKILGVLLLICVSFCIWATSSYYKVKAENVTLQTAIKQPAVVQKPKYIERVKIVYKTVKEPTNIVAGADEEAYSDMAQMEEFYKAKIAELEANGGNTVEVEKPVYITTDYNDTDEIYSDMNQMQSYYEQKIAEIQNQFPSEITREVYVNEGSESKPTIPVKVDVVKNKDWTAMAEYKLNDGLNLGISKRVLGELSIGGSVDQDAHLGLIGQVGW